MGMPWVSVALVSIYPILVMIGVNLDEVILQDVFFPIFISLFISLLIYWILFKLTNNQHKAALVTISSLLFFYFYGHVFYGYISGIHWGENTIGRHRFFYPLWILLFFSSIFLILRVKKSLKSSIKFINYLTIFLVLVATAPIFVDFIFEKGNTQNNIDLAKVAKVNEIDRDMPNIYYIVLDGYASFDILNDVYYFDNSIFKESLESQGFFVADKSSANHSFTYLSLSSSLNMMYMDWVGEDNELSNTKLRELGSYIANNKVAKHLKKAGYKYITFDSGYSTSSTTSFVADLNIPCAPVSEFERILLRTTMLDPFFLYGGVRDTILCQFETVGNVAKSNPNFIFAHIVAPHPPFVFDSNGGNVGMNSGINPWSDKSAFVEQTKFVNKKVLEAITSIKENSKIDPIIIIQSDHGPASSGTEEMLNPSDLLIKERMRILNAYYVPESIKKKLYKEITPVNSFRVILSDLLKLDIDLLQDVNWFTPIGQDVYSFDDVSDIVKYE